MGGPVPEAGQRSWSRSGPASGLCASCGAARSRSGRSSRRPLGSGAGFVDVTRGHLIYCAQFCARCARICAPAGDHSVVLGTYRWHLRQAQIAPVPQGFHCLRALGKDLYRYRVFSQPTQMAFRRSRVRSTSAPPIKSSLSRKPRYPRLVQNSGDRDLGSYYRCLPQYIADFVGGIQKFSCVIRGENFHVRSLNTWRFYSLR